MVKPRLEPKRCAQRRAPVGAYFATKRLVPPLVKVTPPKSAVPAKEPVTKMLFEPSTATPPPLSVLEPPKERAQETEPVGAYLARKISGLPPLPPALVREMPPNSTVPL